MFCAAMALTYGCTIVVFSPSRRTSDQILQRMHDFVKLLGMADRVVSCNIENLVLRTEEGGTSLLRSFPSKISVSLASKSP